MIFKFRKNLKNYFFKLMNNKNSHFLYGMSACGAFI